MKLSVYDRFNQQFDDDIVKHIGDRIRVETNDNSAYDGRLVSVHPSDFLEVEANNERYMITYDRFRYVNIGAEESGDLDFIYCSDGKTACLGDTVRVYSNVFDWGKDYIGRLTEITDDLFAIVNSSNGTVDRFTRKDYGVLVDLIARGNSKNPENDSRMGDTEGKYSGDFDGDIMNVVHFDHYYMSTYRFQQLLDELDGNSLQTLKEKNARYSANGDALHNFRSGAEIAGGTPAQACWGYLTKHLVALRDMVQKDDFSNREDFLEKCQDTINYIRFLWCIGNEENQNKKESN